MSNKDIKYQLHEGIEKIEDSSFLLTLKELIAYKYTSPDSLKLTSWQKKRIRESENQIENGESFTDEKANKIIDQWLKK